MPGIGLGTFGSDNYSADDIGVAVRGAIEIGYRHIDCASVYGNEREVGAAAQQLTQRDDEEVRVERALVHLVEDDMAHVGQLGVELQPAEQDARRD